MSEISIFPEVVTGQAAEVVLYPEDRIRITKQPNGGIQVAIYESADRVGPPPHRHPWDEVQIVVDGFAEFRLRGDEWVGGGEGTVQFLPAGNPHSVRVPQGEARLIQVSIGSPYDGFARDMARLMAGAASLDQIAAVAESHGVQLAEFE